MTGALPQDPPYAISWKWQGAGLSLPLWFPLGTRANTTARASFSGNGGDWQGIGETVTVAGPTGELPISEATAVLSGQYE